jgi:hypothetical protein
MSTRVTVLVLLLSLVFVSEAWSGQKRPTTITSTTVSKVNRCHRAYDACASACGKWDSVDLNQLNTCLKNCQSTRDKCLARAGVRPQ